MAHGAREGRPRCHDAHTAFCGRRPGDPGRMDPQHLVRAAGMAYHGRGVAGLAAHRRADRTPRANRTHGLLWGRCGRPGRDGTPHGVRVPGRPTTRRWWTAATAADKCPDIASSARVGNNPAESGRPMNRYRPRGGWQSVVRYSSPSTRAKTVMRAPPPGSPSIRQWG
jgi:hypothetical protein